MGELLTLLNCESVPELGVTLADYVDGSEESWIDFDEGLQEYVFGYPESGTDLVFPVDTADLIDTMEQFNDLFLERLEESDNDDLGLDD